MADFFIIRTPLVGQLSKHKERELISIISYRYLISCYREATRAEDLIKRLG